jgi:hypothetical protein
MKRLFEGVTNLMSARLCSAYPKRFHTPILSANCDFLSYEKLLAIIDKGNFILKK